MPEGQKSSADAAFNIEELLARVENDRELLRELLSIFREDFPRHLEALRKAVNSSDGQRVAAVAHRLKGMLSNLAASRAAAAAGHLEQLGRAQDLPGIRNAWVAFEKDAAELEPQLNACVAKECR